MTRDIILLGERVEEDKYLIAQLIHEDVLKDANPTEIASYGDLLETVMEFRAGLIGLFGKSITNFFDQEKAYKELSEWGHATGNYFLQEGMTLDTALVETNIYRKHISKVIKSEAKLKNVELDVLFEVLDFFHALLDHAVHAYSFAYINSYQKNLDDARKEYLELSSPVVPVNDDIAILPLVGAIEVDRAAHIMEKTLLSASRLRVSTLIIDLSGVVKVDEMVAHQIINLTEALNLIGVRAVLTGIRPEIAQTMTHLGVDVGKLALGGSLKLAFKKLTAEKR